MRQVSSKYSEVDSRCRSTHFASKENRVQADAMSSSRKGVIYHLDITSANSLGVIHVLEPELLGYCPLNMLEVALRQQFKVFI